MSCRSRRAGSSTVEGAGSPGPSTSPRVTDHAEMIGGPGRLHDTPGIAGYESEVCKRFRAPWKAFEHARGRAWPMIVASACETWIAMRSAAKAARSRRALPRREWPAPGRKSRIPRRASTSPLRFHDLRRLRVLFANPRDVESPPQRRVPKRTPCRPCPSLLATDPRTRSVSGGRARKRSASARALGCDALTIPHNPNLSNGRVIRRRLRRGCEQPRRSARASRSSARRWNPWSRCSRSRATRNVGTGSRG